jgi:regulatory protein
MNLLLRQDRTRKELSDRLSRAGFSEEAIGYALEYVESFGYVNDKRYAQNYVAFHKGELSARELRYKLTGKGVPPEILSEVFTEYEPEDEEDALCRKLEKRLRGKRLSDMDAAEKNKVVSYLTRKGYRLTAVKRMMQEWEHQE